MKNLIVIFIGLMISASVIAEVDFEREKKLESQFSTWDGSHRKLERYIKNQLNDSDSYEHVQTGYSPSLTPMQVGTRFRAKNAYGAHMINDVLAEVSDEGEVLRILKWR